ncbi:hypothetical protein ACET3Z_016497 [Daucus carota]
MASHFVLVHGACHGSWCWYKVATLLKSAGHKVTALDLGGAGINPKQRHQMTTLSDQLEPLMEFLAALQPEEKVILVGHSMGGIAISVAAEKFTKSIAAVVYVTAFMPNPANFNLHQLYQQVFDLQPDNNGKRFAEAGAFQDSKFMFEEGPDSSSVLFGPNFMKCALYQLSPPEDLTLAMSLLRPFPIFRDDLSQKEAELTDRNYGSTRRVYIVCKEDLIITEETQKASIANYPPQDVKEISGADHMVMFSKPQELASVLQAVAQEM